MIAFTATCFVSEELGPACTVNRLKLLVALLKVRGYDVFFTEQRVMVEVQLGYIDIQLVQVFRVFGCSSVSNICACVGICRYILPLSINLFSNVSSLACNFHLCELQACDLYKKCLHHKTVCVPLRCSPVRQVAKEPL